MNVNDRGTKKWTSLMLPEHVEALRKMWREMEYKEKPALDEQQLQENEFKLKSALQNKLKARITYFIDHDFEFVEGLIQHIRNNIIYIGETEINFDDILEVDLLTP